MAFPTLTPAQLQSQTAARLDAAQREIATFAALLFRLGYSTEQATQRIQARVAWEFDQPGQGNHRRGPALSDSAIAELVTATYARRPT